MTTPSMPHRPSTIVVATSATGLVGALLAVTLSSAHAIPERLDVPAGADRGAHTDSRRLERACFITPPTWNVALDGPMPRCYTYLP
jgi:hypothetical protein